MKLTVDFETRSACDIKKAGAWRYAEDPSTDPLCLAIKVDNNPPGIWVNFKTLPHGITSNHLAQLGGPRLSDNEAASLVERADVIEAHNAEFERSIWKHQMVAKLDFAPIPLEKWRCSAALAAAYSLPRSLGHACHVLGLRQQKDSEGHALMLQLCKPRKPRKAERERDKDWETRLYWWEDPAKFVRLCKYCIQDVNAGHALAEYLGGLSPEELEVWFLDQIINERGIHIDVPGVEAAIAMVQEHEARLLTVIQDVTHGQVQTAKQVEKIKAWLRTRGVELADLTAATVKQTLSQPTLPRDVRQLLEARASIGGASTAKYEAFLRVVGADNRARGMLLYHAASTGRWGGRLAQPHNMPRGKVKLNEDELIDQAYDTMRGGPDDAGWLWGADPMDLASSAVRGAITAENRKKLKCSDFSSVEARVNAWLAGQESVLKAFREGRDLYKVAADDLWQCGYDNVTKDQRQVGKVEELALGYGGGIGAFASMAVGYGVDLEQLPAHVLPLATPEQMEKADRLAVAFLSRNPGSMSHDAALACDVTKQRWREARPMIVRFWYALEGAAKSAVQSPGIPYQVGRVVYAVKGRWLWCRLPSGRSIRYFEPQIRKSRKFGVDGVESLTYWGVDSKTHQWCRQEAYGGKLCENVVQAVSACLLRAALFRAEAAGYPVVMHVHDEVVSEVPEDMTEGPDDFDNLVGAVPPWAEGLPMKASGWIGRRYRKD